MDIAKAQDIIESVFTFDKVGDSMMAVRKNPDSEDSQKRLLEDLFKAAIEEASEANTETNEILQKAADERVQQFVAGIKSASTGCGGVK